MDAVRSTAPMGLRPTFAPRACACGLDLGSGRSRRFRHAGLLASSAVGDPTRLILDN